METIAIFSNVYYLHNYMDKIKWVKKTAIRIYFNLVGRRF